MPILASLSQLTTCHFRWIWVCYLLGLCQSVILFKLINSFTIKISIIVPILTLAILNLVISCIFFQKKQNTEQIYQKLSTFQYVLYSIFYVLILPILTPFVFVYLVYFAIERRAYTNCCLNLKQLYHKIFESDKNKKNLRNPLKIKQNQLITKHKHQNTTDSDSINKKIEQRMEKQDKKKVNQQQKLSIEQIQSQFIFPLYMNMSRNHAQQVEYLLQRIQRERYVSIRQEINYESIMPLNQSSNSQNKAPKEN